MVYNTCSIYIAYKESNTKGGDVRWVGGVRWARVGDCRQCVMFLIMVKMLKRTEHFLMNKHFKM